MVSSLPARAGMAKCETSCDGGVITSVQEANTYSVNPNLFRGNPPDRSRRLEET